MSALILCICGGEISCGFRDILLSEVSIEKLNDSLNRIKNSKDFIEGTLFITVQGVSEISLYDDSFRELFHSVYGLKSLFQLIK